MGATHYRKEPHLKGDEACFSELEINFMIIENKKVVAGILVGLIVVAVSAVVLYRGFRTGVPVIQNLDIQEVSTGDPVDIVLDFYNPWLEASRSTSTSPYVSGFASGKLLSSALRTRLMSTEGNADTEIDPVLCQTTTPARVTGRVVSEQEDVIRVLVMAKEKELTGQSVFTLRRQNDGWFIDDIVCSPGEFDLPREFSFDREGYLLKNVPLPLNQNSWHIVFEENGELGHAVPLFFGATSTCMAIDKNESVCSPDQFVEATKIHAYGQMTESGIDVARLEFLE